MTYVANAIGESLDLLIREGDRRGGLGEQGEDGQAGVTTDHRHVGLGGCGALHLWEQQRECTALRMAR